METENAAAVTKNGGNGGGLAAEARGMRFDTGTEHPNANIPFTATIDGRQFNGSSISLVSAKISGLAGTEMEGAERIAILRFGFGAYSISVPVSVQISRIDASTGTLRLDFLEPTGEHLPVLRHLLNSFVAGDIVSLGGLISVRDRQNFGANPKLAVSKTLSQRVTFIGRSLATGAITIALLGVAGKLAYERFFSSEVKQFAVVTRGGEPMRAIAPGQVAYLNPAAAKGEIIYSIRTASGDTLSVVMPCDCEAAATGLSEGSTVLSGEAIVELLRPGATPSVAAVVDFAQAKNLLDGDVAELQFAGGGTLTTKLTDGGVTILPLPGSDKLRAVFPIKNPALMAAGKDPVSVRIVDARLYGISNWLSGRYSLLMSK
jgi:mannuronan synthase